MAFQQDIHCLLTQPNISSNFQNKSCYYTIQRDVRAWKRTLERLSGRALGRTDRQLFSSIWIAKKIGFLFILVSSALRDEMPPYVAFHQDLHCLQKVLVYQYPD